MAENEVPVVPPLRFRDIKTLHQINGLQFSVFPRQSGRVPEIEGREKLLLSAYSSVTEYALDSVRRCSERAGKVKNLWLHGDCYPGNILWTYDGPHFVDFEDSRMGPAIQDLWMLLSGDRTEMAL